MHTTARSPEEFHRFWWTRVEGGRTKFRQVMRKDPCAFCTDGEGGTLDHISPRHVASGHERGSFMNWTGACPDCNFNKGSGHFLWWFAIKQGQPIIGVEFSPKAEDQFNFVPYESLT